MKSTLIYQPSSEALQAIDQKIDDFVKRIQTEITESENEFGYSMYEGALSRMAVLEVEPQKGEKLKPFRTISVEGMKGIVDAGLALESFGLTCINKSDIYPTQGYDCIYVLK